ncbi:FHA domain-containing protein [Mycolicibacterium arseniciresistens]|uniref:FHA domain-containing protein n=1 Tax=Mycolicibacterium arseniciresistens TaxID=3062257 RepID=A0ABT8UMT0_9MYCO|nr:FHA domain-containing protein [Mycolicibacterium arseniciresistens]MDO3639099.1 FHA domain-containing protein [Mycolicibacterium arseniciresistens]
MPTCDEGHDSAAEDYCEVCGSSMRPAAGHHASEIPPALCPACRAPVTGRFCEVCGNDSALQPPDDAPAQEGDGAECPAVWTVVIGADPDFYGRVVARGGPDTVEFPEVFPERRIRLRHSTTLIGRRHREQGVQPGIDLGIHPVDRGVSTQHAVLRLSATGLTVTDLGSTNGTSLNGSDDFLGNGEETPLTDGDRIHVGAWTTITIVREPGEGRRTG